jgi:flagellar hook assembly protein FlgD
LTVAPNPARGPVDISFVVPAGERWRLDVVDLHGRRVRNVASGVGDGDMRSFRWDGRDRSGAFVPAGIYWVRVERQGTQSVRRIAIMDPR